MKLFDKTYLYCVPDEDTKALIGKKVFYGNDVDTVIDNVNNETEYPNLDSRGILNCIYTRSVNAVHPFAVLIGSDLESFNCMFVYYDPYYDFKVAYNEGKTIQYQLVGGIDWKDIETESELLNYIDENRTLRIKPEESRRVTYRELTKWLAKGKGQALYCDIILTDFKYDLGVDSKMVDEDIRVRRWIDNDWHEPTAEYLGIKD